MLTPMNIIQPDLAFARQANRANILIVDDNRTNLRILVEILTVEGYKARPATSGQLALAAAQADPPDLILLDIVMPDMDGYEVCHHLKEHPCTRHIPIIFISALNEVFDKVKAFSAGGVDYITKPFQVEEVLVRVETHLTLRRLRQNLERQNKQLEQEVTDRKQIENDLAHVNRTLQQRVDELSTLNRIAQIVASTLDLGEMLDLVSRELVKIFEASSTGVMLLDETGQEVTLFADYAATADTPSMVGLTVPVDQTIAAHHIFVEKKPFIFKDVQNNPQINHSRHFLRERNVQCLMIVPLLSRGEVIGTISIDSEQPDRECTATEVALAETIAVQVAGAIDQARLFERERQLRHEAESLREVAATLGASLDEQTVLTKILEQLRRVIRYDSASVFLQEGNDLVMVAGTDLAKPRIGNRLSLAGPAPGIPVFREKKPTIIADTHNSPRWQWVWEGLEYIRGWMCVPLVANDRAIGILCVDSFFPDAYTPADAQLVQIFAGQAAIAIDNARLFDATEQSKQRLQTLYERIHDELALAQEIQYTLLPPPRPAYDRLDIICYSQPMREVGGDFYGYHRFPAPPSTNGRSAPAHFAVAVGDVSGKGVSAALLMAASLAQFDAVLSKNMPPPERMLALDEAIEPYTRSRQQNCALCYLEIVPPAPDEEPEQPGELSIINAGCIPPYLKRADGRVEWHELGGPALGQGLGRSLGYEETRLPLAPGDLIILTSDGVVEAMNSAEEILGFERLQALIADGPAGNAEAMLDYLRNHLADFTRTADPHDDITIVVINVK